MTMRSARLLILLGLPVSLTAQLVRGRVVDARNQPISQALVVLNDSVASLSIRVLTTSSGNFAVSAPRAGRFTLRIAGIGYLPTVTKMLDVKPDGVLLGDLVLEDAVMSLAEIQVFAEKPGCGGPNPGAETLGKLLDAAQTSLEVMEASLQSRNGGYSVEYITRRSLGINGRKSVEEDTSASRMVDWPIKSVSQDSLRIDGFSVPLPDATNNGREWYGPDVRVLFSEWFLANHCFRLKAESTDSSTIAIAFVPVGTLEGYYVDISGVLYLDRGSLALKSLSYEHTNMPIWLEDGMAGGNMEFAKLASGVWLPVHWSIFAPIQSPAGRAVGSLSQTGVVVNYLDEIGPARQ